MMSSDAAGRHVRAENFELVVAGEVGPALLKSLDGFVIARVDDGRTHMVGRVNDQADIYALLAAIGDAGVHLVSFNPETG
jgi:hypothetical protein